MLKFIYFFEYLAPCPNDPRYTSLIVPRLKSPTILAVSVCMDLRTASRFVEDQPDVHILQHRAKHAGTLILDNSAR